MSEKNRVKLDDSYSNLGKKESKNKFKVVENSSRKPRRQWLVLLILGIIGVVGGIICFVVPFCLPKDERAAITFPTIPSAEQADLVYSKLTGKPLADSALVNAPAYCIQIPNGTDGGRPQAGLTEAGVVFEAIAEAGITRFAAIFQNPTSAVIGPIRSLRLYYLEWDTPFDCTIVHAGGAADALAAVASGGYKDLTENYSYMYRGTYSRRLWNNLFTTATDLRKFSSDRGYNSSDVKGFARLTPEESQKSMVDDLVVERLEITTPATKSTTTLAPKVSAMNLRFGNIPNFNVHYDYDAKSNTYARSYQSGVAHEVYQCPTDNLGEKNPEDVCSLTQVAPSVVVAMVVKEKKASDNYHEDITVVGSGDVYIFQNGNVVRGTWNKATRSDQIKFLDTTGKEIKLAPGQTFVSAIPNYGSIEY